MERDTARSIISRPRSRPAASGPGASAVTSATRNACRPYSVEMSLYVFRPDPDGAREWRERREVERARLHGRYIDHLVSVCGLDAAVAGGIIDALFVHRDRQGQPCLCSCHPRLSSEHGDGFDCTCTWSDERRAEQRRTMAAFWASPASQEVARHHEEQEREIATWLAWHPGVEAQRKVSYAPEVWEGAVDGHSFHFRERHGAWRLELDLVPSGRFVERVTSVGDDGDIATEPEEVTEGAAIGEGVDGELGASPVDHLAFIVTRIREHLRAEACHHDGARLYCPDCGRRVG